jgi:hypothetical protein
MEIRNVLTVAYFVLSIYMYGGGVMSTLVYYESWKLVGEEEFAAVHSSVTSRMLPRFVPILVLLVLVNTSLIWFHHPAISTWLIVLTAAIHLLMVVMRFAVFVPIHKKLDKAKSIELIDRLLKYDIYMGSGNPRINQNDCHYCDAVSGGQRVPLLRQCSHWSPTFGLVSQVAVFRSFVTS